MDIKINIYLTDTLYQVLAAFNLANQEFGGDEYVNHIYFFTKEKKLTYIDENLSCFNGFVRIVEEQARPLQVKRFCLRSYHRFIYFQEANVLYYYLAHKLRRKGTIIALGPDGTKPYGVFSKSHEILTMIRDTLMDYRLLIRHEIFLWKIVFFWKYRYGSTKILDEVWLQYPALFNSNRNKTNKSAKIIRLPDLVEQNITRLFSKRVKNIDIPEESIVYFNQPFWSKGLQEKELEILIKLKRIFNKKVVFIKLHPSTSLQTQEAYKSLGFIKIIENKIPAELLLVHLQRPFLFTGWSASIMHKIPKNAKWFYLYQLYKPVNDRILNQIHLTPFEHIKMVNDISSSQNLLS